jgi:hypothetical protein
MVRAGDNPMQKLAMMMAVMILGMSPAHGYSISADSGSLEIGDQVEMMSLIPRWYSDDGTLTARNMVNLAAAEGYRPVEPGGYSVGRNWQPSQLRLGQDEAEEALEEQRERLDPGGGSQVYRLEGETTPKTTEALRKGADAARGRSQSHQGKNGRN